MKTIQVKVKPNSKTQAITSEADGSFTIRLKSPPVDGKANAELIALLAKTYSVSKSQIQIKTGAAAKFKRIEIDIP